MIERFVPQTCVSSKKIAPTPLQAIAQLQRDGWYFEPKLDGVRAIAYVEAGTVTLINRRMADITGRYPEVVAALQCAFPTQTIALDGEVVCYGEDDKPDFSRIHKRDAQPPTKTAVIEALAVQMPATFVAFDVLHNEGDDLRGQPYVARRVLLHTLTPNIDTGCRTLTEAGWTRAALQVITSGTDGAALWAHAEANGLEGLIAKQRTSPYRPGRSQCWVKLKKVDTVSCVATGYDIGEGSRAGTIGAINLALIDGAEIIDVGRVGTGFKDSDLVDLKRRMDAGQVLVLEVEYANWGATSKKLRFPAYKGVRSDVAPTDCTLDQLNPALMLGDAQVNALVQR